MSANEQQIEFMAKLFFNDLKTVRRGDLKFQLMVLDSFLQTVDLTELVKDDLDRLVFHYKVQNSLPLDIKAEDKEVCATRIVVRIHRLIEEGVLVV